jgi:hypothetical protein
MLMQFVHMSIGHFPSLSSHGHGHGHGHMSMSTICPGGTYQAWHVDAINQNYIMAVPFKFKSMTLLMVPVTVMSLIF